MVFCDVETTGLDFGDRILEIAVLVTDPDLRPLGEPISIVLPATDARLEAMPDIVKNMHRTSGLWQECRMASGTIEEAEERIMEYVRAHTGPKIAPMGGSTISFDRRFLKQELPTFEDYCLHRCIDVSSVKELARRWNPGVYARLPRPARRHRALSDIADSISELSFYRQHFLRCAAPAALG